MTPDFGPAAADDLLDAFLDDPTAIAAVDPSLDGLVALLAAAASDLDGPAEPPRALLLAIDAAAAVVPIATMRLRRVVPLAVVAVGLVAGTGAAAAKGSLPGPIQDAFHAVADAVGVDIPASDDERGPGTSGVDGIGEDGIPPGQGGTVPGTGEDGGGNGVGQDGTPPGQGGTVPGTGEDGGGTGVGQDGTPPGQDGTTPTPSSTIPGGGGPPSSRPTPSNTIPEHGNPND